MKRIFLKDLKLKALAVVFAAALWFFVAGQSSTEVGFLVPVGFKGMPGGMAVGSAPPEEIEVRVTGPKFFINDLSPSQIKVELDMTEAREGLNSMRILPGDVNVPMGVEVVKTRPVSVDIRLERLVTVNLPVKARLTGRPAAGYKVVDVSVSPRTVAATGVKKEMGELSNVHTRPVDVSGLASTARFTVQLDLPERGFRSMSDDRVEVMVVVGRADRGG